MEYPAQNLWNTAFASEPASGSIRLLIADPELSMRDRLALVLGAMGGARIVCRAANAAEVGQWVAAQPFGWDVALVDAAIAADPAAGLRHCGCHTLAKQTVFVLADDAPPAPSCSNDALPGCYDKRRDLGLIVAMCIRLRDARRIPAGDCGVVQG